MHAVTLVVHQSEHRLRERVALNGAATIEVEGGVIGLRHAKTVLIHEAYQAKRPRISPLGERYEIPRGADVIAVIKGGSAAAERVGARRRGGDHDENRRRRSNEPAPRGARE